MHKILRSGWVYLARDRQLAEERELVVAEDIVHAALIEHGTAVLIATVIIGLAIPVGRRPVRVASRVQRLAEDGNPLALLVKVVDADQSLLLVEAAFDRAYGFLQHVA